MTAVPDDVRMRGFRTRTPLAEAQAWVDALEAPERVESVPLGAAHDRVLAEDVVAPCAVPAFARAAMDGWALRAEATFGATADDPLALRLVGRSHPGVPYTGIVRAGEAVRIMTGAPVPEGADGVLRAEDGREVEGLLQVEAPTTPGRHVGRRGEDVAVGDLVLGAGRRIRPQDLGLAASVGRGTLRVVARPAVGLIATGNELLAPGSRPEGASIVDSNTPMLEALVARDGGEVVQALRVSDDRAAVAAALKATSGDLLLVSGGSSVGVEDHAPRIVAEQGDLVIHGIGMRPASPAGVGFVGGRPVFLLPGNPVSCLSAYDVLAGRAVRRWAGRGAQWPYREEAHPLRRKLVSVLGRVDYVRVRLVEGGVAPLMSRGASILSSTTVADGFVMVPQDAEGWPEGEVVRVWRYA